MKSLPALALALSMAHGGTQAAEDIEPTSNWITSAELGAISTSGNTSGASVTGKIEALQELPLWSNEYIVSAYFKEDRARTDGVEHSERSAERFAISAKAGYKLLEEDETLYMLATHVEDKFGSYTRFSTLGIGRGTRAYKSDTKTLDLEVGPGYFSGTRATGETEKGATIRGAASFRWKISANANFSQNLVVERGTSNMHSAAETSLSTRINGSMQMKAAFIARNDTNVPADKKATDTQTSLTLVYSF
jgi:putative salt-induced outer membrane protein